MEATEAPVVDALAIFEHTLDAAGVEPGACRLDVLLRLPAATGDAVWRAADSRAREEVENRSPDE
jgi:hypothetical protein